MIPVIVDGFVATSAAAIAQAVNPEAIDHCLFAHVSAEHAHGRALAALGKVPLLDLGMRLGEGSGADGAGPVGGGWVASRRSRRGPPCLERMYYLGASLSSGFRTDFLIRSAAIAGGGGPSVATRR